MQAKSELASVSPILTLSILGILASPSFAQSVAGTAKAAASGNATAAAHGTPKAAPLAPNLNKIARILKSEEPILGSYQDDAEAKPQASVFLNGSLEQNEQQSYSSIPRTNQYRQLNAQADSWTTKQYASAIDNHWAGQVLQVWYKIPGWLAGTWRTTEKKLIGEINMKTGREEGPRNLDFGYCGETYGFQQAKNGTFWQYAKIGSAPINVKPDRLGRSRFNIIDSQEAISFDENQLVLRKRGRAITMYADTQEILFSHPFESIVRFTRTGNSSINIDEKITRFDGTGRTISLREVATAKERISPYREVDEKQGDDLHASFASYLGQHGLGNLSSAPSSQHSGVFPADSLITNNSEGRNNKLPYTAKNFSQPSNGLHNITASNQIKSPKQSAEKFEVDIDLDHM